MITRQSNYRRPRRGYFQKTFPPPIDSLLAVPRSQNAPFPSQVHPRDNRRSPFLLCLNQDPTRNPTHARRCNRRHRKTVISTTPFSPASSTSYAPSPPPPSDQTHFSCAPSVSSTTLLYLRASLRRQHHPHHPIGHIQHPDPLHPPAEERPRRPNRHCHIDPKASQAPLSPRFPLPSPQPLPQSSTPTTRHHRSTSRLNPLLPKPPLAQLLPAQPAILITATIQSTSKPAHAHRSNSNRRT